MRALVLLRLTTIASATVLLSGCQLVRDLAKYDVSETGGIAGHYASKYVMPASTSEMEEYRAAEVYAILADAATQVATTPADEQYVIEKIVDTNSDLNLYYAETKIDCKAATGAEASNILKNGCLGDYEADMRNVEGDLTSLAKVAVPTDKLQSIVSQLESGNYLASVSTLTTITGQLIVIFHRGAAIDRAGIQVIMQYEAPAPPANSFDASIAAYNSQGKLVGSYPVEVNAINAMYHIAYDSCTRLATRLSQPSINILKTDYIDDTTPAHPVCKLSSAQ